MSAPPSLLRPLLGTAVAWHEIFGRPRGAVRLEAEEAQTLGEAAPERRREFALGRHCARLALGDLGFGPVAIPRGEDRRPLWPDGVVGSITHCPGYCGAAVAQAHGVAAIGIDAERGGPLDPDVLGVITSGPAERRDLAMLTRLDPLYARALFSAKESVFKAWYPLAGRWLDFEEATVHFDPARRTFHAELHVPGPEHGGRPLEGLAGRYLLVSGFVATAVVLPAARPSSP